MCSCSILVADVDGPLEINDDGQQAMTVEEIQVLQSLQFWSFDLHKNLQTVYFLSLSFGIVSCHQKIN